VDYINVDEGIGYCLVLTNKMRRNFINVGSGFLTGLTGLPMMSSSILACGGVYWYNRDEIDW